MKTADVELTDAGKSGRSLGSLFGLSDNKKAPKFKAGSHPSAGGAASEKTQISQSIADVVKLLRADAATKIGVHADKGFFNSFKSAAGDIECLWLSNDFVVDQQLGALPLTGDHLKSCQAIVVGGPDVGTKYRLTLRGTLAHAQSVPVHWVADNWEFCGGTCAVPLEIEDVDALVFNHFEQFFGIKDPLQFRFEIISEEGIKRRYRVMGPSQSLNLNLNEFAGERTGPVCLKVFVSHPNLTRGRHYRFRVCADVFWKDFLHDHPRLAPVLQESEQGAAVPPDRFRDPRRACRDDRAELRSRHGIRRYHRHRQRPLQEGTEALAHPAGGRGAFRAARHAEQQPRLFRRVGTRATAPRSGTRWRKAASASRASRAASPATIWSRSGSTTARTRRSGRMSCTWWSRRSPPAS